LTVFDVGGTAVRDTADVAAVFRATLEQYGIVAPPNKIGESRGASKREVIAELLGGANARSRGVEAVPGVAAAFDRLRANGIKVVLTTGFDTRTMAVVLQQLDWEGVVDFVVTADDVVRGRPAPDLILTAMRRAEVVRGDAVVTVGDTVNDLRAAAAAGVGASVGVLTGAHDRKQRSAVPHTIIRESAAEVPRWLSDRDWSAG
jgi:phosphoglycolate phosphatase-like HAD superfamily hydrolase